MEERMEQEWILERMLEEEREQTKLLRDILKELRPHQPGIALSVRTQFEKEKQKMPLTAPANTQNEKYFAIGVDASGLSGASLGPGQTISIVSADPATVDFGPPDSPAGKDAEGVQSMLSVAVIFKNPPAQPNVPINVTLSVLNADGSAADGTPLVDTVTVTPAVAGVAVSVGDLFEQGVQAAGLAPAAAAKQVSSPGGPGLNAKAPASKQS
jgi:hypothetical protein